MRTHPRRRFWRYLVPGLALVAGIAPLAGDAQAHPDPGDGHLHDGSGLDGHRADPSDALEARDASTSNVISTGPSAKIIKNLDVVGRGVRNVGNATTDVWALDGYAYTGTFNSPCGGEPDAGIWVWDVHNANKPSLVTVIPSPTGSRTNDVRVASMNMGDILVHSNESCAGGPGGFEVYDVDDPANPVHLASVQTDDVNAFLRDAFGFVDFGVHNLFLFSQGGNDYVAATVESEFGNFQIFDLADLAAGPVGFFGAESLGPDVTAYPSPWPDEDYATLTDFGKILDVDAYLFSGFGASQNKFLHDITISADGTRAYLANWDAGLVLLDISDVTDPQVISVAIDPVNGSLDGEVNSHSVWPSEDGTIVVEGEEDFSAWEGSVPPSNLTLDGTATPGDPTIPATAISTTDGDDFEANQTGNFGTTDGASVAVTSGPLAGTTYPAVELATAAGSPTFATTGPVSGELVWIGRACTATQSDTVLNAGDVDPGDIAVVRRGACEFEEKANTAAALGAAAVIISNNQPSTPWSGLRIWDYSDPADPVLTSTFDTTCSASSEPSAECDVNGTYSVHNVQVETRGNKVLAYVSWYSDGMLVLDVSDPSNPVEVARYLDTTGPNDGLANDFWGVYKEQNSPFFYGSDRNGGLYVFKEKGAGTLN